MKYVILENNFVKKNKLPEEVVNIILKKIKEKELEEKMNN